MAKRVCTKPVWLEAGQVVDIYSISNCISEAFADYIDYWKHNGYWFFDSPEIIKDLGRENSIPLEGTSLFYYEVHETEFDRERWHRFAPEPSFPTGVITPARTRLEGFDVALFVPGVRQNARLFRVILWRKLFVQMITVCSLPSKRPKQISRMGHSFAVNPVLIESSPCIRSTGLNARQSQGLSFTSNRFAGVFAGQRTTTDNQRLLSCYPELEFQ